ncbi:MAG: hypothetical protein GY757_59150, partial [bacterium]|nr:hypothetical protein [bacterium]
MRRIKFKSVVILIFVLVGFGMLDADKERVTVYRDNFGVPHIYAKTAKGLFTTWGYVLAQDRLFQLDVLRATVWGKVAEFYGPGANNIYIEFDKQTRINSYTEAEVIAEILALDLEYQELLGYYAAGINMYIAEALANPNEKLPIEYHNLGMTKVEHFSAADIAQIFIGSMGIRFNELNSELANAAIYKKLVETVGSHNAPAAFSDTFPPQVPHIQTTIPSTTSPTAKANKAPEKSKETITYCNHKLPKSITKIYEKERKRKELIREVLGGSVAQPNKSGSYMWAVAGAKTEGRKEALFINGPQMGFFNPAYLHEVGIHGAGYDVVGTSPVGYPFVEFGHNKTATWGSTAGFGDTVDLFILDLVNDDYHYLHNGQVMEMESRTEVIKVRGGDTITITAYRSCYGPVFAWGDDGHAYTKQRSWEMKLLESLAGWIDSTKAKNFTQFLAGASKMAISINWMYADKKGNIGYLITGRYPI